MRRIRLSLGDGWDIKIFTGDEWKKFVKLGEPCLDHYDKFREILKQEPSNLAICDMIYVKDMNNVATLVHELIHSLTWVRITLGLEDSPLQEWLAYSIGYCMIQLKIDKKL
jgi:ASC-1-like (ASCH) protein